MSKLGYDIFECDGRLEIQKDDEVGAYETDRDAIIAAINDTLGGDVRAAEILKAALLQERATPDIEVQNHGSVVILTARTTAATEWFGDHLDGDAQRWGVGGWVVEPRYVQDILEGAKADGLTVE